MRKVLIALASAAAALLVLELAHRAWLAMNGTPYSPAATRERLYELRDPARRYTPLRAGEGEDRETLLHPYSGSEWEHDTGGVLAYFRRGQPGNEFSVLVVGGSVAGGWAVHRENGFRELLEADERFAGKIVRVLNYAHASYKQPQQLMRVAYLFSLGFRPDAVVNIDGFNEVALSLQGLRRRIHPLYPSFTVWGALVQDLELLGGPEIERMAQLYLAGEEAERATERTLSWGLHRSSLLGTLATLRLRTIAARRADLLEGPVTGGPGARRSDKPDRQVTGPHFDRDPDVVLTACADNWLESSRSLHALCERRGIPYYHVLQPALHDEGAKPFSAVERALPEPPEGWARGPREGYPLLRARAPQLTAEGVRFLDASGAFSSVEETLYEDACHFNGTGNRILSTQLAAAFLGSGD